MSVNLLHRKGAEALEWDDMNKCARRSIGKVKEKMLLASG